MNRGHRIHPFVAIILSLLFASAGSPQASAGSQDRIPKFKVQIWGETFADFSTRVTAFAELRRDLEKGLPPLKPTDHPDEIRKGMHERATRIRAARANAKEGDIFSPAISTVFKEALVYETDAATCEAIRDDNPGAFSHDINGSYPETRTLGTVPPNILAILPKLPDDVQYRFLGRHLVLIDGRSGVILDRIRFALTCAF